MLVRLLRSSLAQLQLCLLLLQVFCKLATISAAQVQIAHCVATSPSHLTALAFPNTLHLTFPKADPPVPGPCAGPLLYIQNSEENSEQSSLQQAVCDGL